MDRRDAARLFMETNRKLYIMPTQSDYRKYLELEFSSIHKALDQLTTDVKEVVKQTTRTNSRVTHLEEFKVEGEEAIRTRVQPHDFGKLVEKVECIEREFRDVGFFVRHPKLFIGLLVVIIGVTVASGVVDLVKTLL
jgi:hypothetical protein